MNRYSSRNSLSSNRSYFDDNTKHIEIRRSNKNSKTISISSIDFDININFKNRKDFYKYTVVQLLIIALFTVVERRLKGYNLNGKNKTKLQEKKDLTVSTYFKSNIQNIVNRVPEIVNIKIFEKIVEIFRVISEFFKDLRKINRPPEQKEERKSKKVSFKRQSKSKKQQNAPENDNNSVSSVENNYYNEQ